MTAIVNWEIDTNFNIDEQLVQYKVSTSSTWITASTVSATTTNYTITSLLDDILYNIRVVSDCRYGGPAPSIIQNIINITCPSITLSSTTNSISYSFTNSSIYNTGFIINLLNSDNTIILNTQNPLISTSISGIFTGLDLNTSYNIQLIISSNSFNKICTTIPFNTSDGVPPQTWTYYKQNFNSINTSLLIFKVFRYGVELTGGDLDLLADPNFNVSNSGTSIYPGSLKFQVSSSLNAKGLNPTNHLVVTQNGSEVYNNDSDAVLGINDEFDFTLGVGDSLSVSITSTVEPFTGSIFNYTNHTIQYRMNLDTTLVNLVGLDGSTINYPNVFVKVNNDQTSDTPIYSCDSSDVCTLITTFTAGIGGDTTVTIPNSGYVKIGDEI